ncbi:MAG TPA: RNA methyltransferase PUA domain-containing protein, partial [Polyangiales bacterium]
MDRADLDEAGVGARRFHCPSLEGSEFELDEAAAQHARVLRLAPGAEVELFDGRGRRAPARVDQLTKGRLRCSATG